jgi:DNA-binding transcriptional LysR family regulator
MVSDMLFSFAELGPATKDKLHSRAVEKKGSAGPSVMNPGQQSRAPLRRPLRYAETMKRNLAVVPDVVRGMMALVAIADSSSFAGAAQELGLTASAVSKLVSRMEARMRVRLVHRTTRRVRLTEMGLLYCERARRVLEELDTSERELEHLDPEPKGTLSVTAPVVLGRARVLPVVMAFQGRHPGVRVVFEATDRVVDLIQERIDVAVRTVAEPPPTMVARKLDDDVRLLCASPAYLAARGAPKSPTDLARHDCLPCRVHGEPAPWRFKAVGGAPARSLTVDGRLHLSDSHSIREAALAGLGIADLPRYLVAQDLEAGRLVRVLEHAPREVRGIYVLYAPSPFTSAKVRLFVDALKAAFRS